MPLIVEDGTIVTDANSLVTVAQARSFASDRGVELSSTDADIEVLAIKAMDYLVSQELSYKGEAISKYVPFPRAGLPGTIDSLKLARNAQCALIIELHNGTDILPTGDGTRVTKEKIGPIETEYYEESLSTPMPVMHSVEAFLAPLRKNFTVVTRI